MILGVFHICDGVLGLGSGNVGEFRDTEWRIHYYRVPRYECIYRCEISDLTR